MEKEIRWKQRFVNFERAFFTLKEAVLKVKSPSNLEKEGTIQRFEFTHELAWNVMKDFLEYEGIQDIIGSRSATRQAFNSGIIENGEIWMQMIESRNITVHSYDDQILSSQYLKIVNHYYDTFEIFYKQMKARL